METDSKTHKAFSEKKEKNILVQILGRHCTGLKTGSQVPNMRETCFSNTSLLSHLGLLKLGLTLGLFLMLTEAIVEAGLLENSKDGLVENSKDGLVEAKARDEESLEDKLRQHLAAANTTGVTLLLSLSSIVIGCWNIVTFCSAGSFKTVSPL